ncbi:MAG: RNA polymerase sigma factor [Gaiellaceae bacterium]
MYRTHLPGLFGFLVYRTGNRALAEDLTAETFARALSRRSRFDRRRASEKTWLYAIALNLLRDHVRHTDAESRAMERVETLALVSAGGTPTPVDAVETRDTVQRALTTLSTEERDAIALRYGAELTIPEIAQVTGEEQTTVDGRVYRALRKLRAELKPAAAQEARAG